MAFFRNTKRLVILLVSLVLLYTLVGFVVIPWVAKAKLPAILSEQLDRPVVVGDVVFNPFMLSLSVRNLEVQEQDQSPLFGFGELFVNVQASSIFRQVYTFEEIRLVLPYGLLKIRPDGTMNVAELGPATPSESGKASADAEPAQETDDETGVPAIEIHRLAIEQGMVEFHDESRSTPFHIHIVPIAIALNNFATHPDLENPYVVTAELSDGEVLEWEGTLVLEPFSSQGKISLTGFQLHTPWRYLQDQLRFEIQDGVLNVSTEYQVAMQGEHVDTTLRKGEIHVRELRMAAKGSADTVFAIPSLDVEGVTVDVTQQQVTIPLIRSKDATFVTWLNNQGAVNYQDLFAPIDSTEQGQGSVQESESNASTSQDPPVSEKLWVVDVQDFAVGNYAIEFEDRTLPTPTSLNLTGIDLQVKELKTSFEEPFDLSLVVTVNDSGAVQTTGSVGVDPVMVDLELSLSELALSPFAPYLSPHVQFELDDGVVDLEGTVTYQDAPAASPLVHYDGGIALNRFVARDPELDEEFLKIESLAVNGLKLDVEPTAVSIEEVALSKPFIKATIGPDGVMNVSRLFSPPGSQDEPEQESQDEASSSPESADGEQQPLPVKIDAVRLTNAATQFADQSIEPNVLTGIQELTGTIAGLSSAQVAKADVDLKGKVDKYAPFEVQGKINPLSRDAYTDLTLLFKNIDLTAVSPYSGKYAGHPITKGKLSLDLQYKVAEHLLEGENKVLVDQLTMGAKTGSPDATSLPVPLALALLKDRHGKIDIDLPVRGNLDDPDFSYGGVVIQALINLLTKAVASPFNLVGGLIGGESHDLQFVEFRVGSQELDEAEQEKLHSLAKALEERPALRLEVTGTADPARDRQALSEAKLTAQLEALQAKEADSSSSSVSEAAETEMDVDEERRLIRLLFVQQFGEAEAAKLEAPPESAQGEPWEQMKRQLLGAIDVHESEVRLLAQRRAQAIRDHLIQQGKIPEEQVFLIQVQVHAEADQDRVRSPLSLAAG